MVMCAFATDPADAVTVVAVVKFVDQVQAFCVLHSLVADGQKELSGENGTKCRNCRYDERALKSAWL